MLLRLSVGLSFVALLVLAGLQYDWIGQISAAEQQRLERSVAESSRELADDFVAELRGLGNALEPRFSPASSDPSLVAARYQEWTTNAPYPNLVRALYIVQSSKGVLRLNVASGTFEPDPSPTALEAARTDGLLIAFNRRFPGLRGLDLAGTTRGGGLPADREPSDTILAELDQDVIVDQILPRLVARRFTDYEGRDYRVAIIASQPGVPTRKVFTSGDSWTQGDLESPDFSMELLGQAPLPPRRGNVVGPPPQRIGRGGERGRGPEQRGPVVTFVGQTWQLLVKHRAGSVQTAVAAFRRRNLVVSFGVLVVLGISAIAIVISGGRARRLGRLQMEFAAGISHELRTPLAVIQSAAHNLGAGVVKDEEGIREYAAIMGGEARRLTDMIEQVMAYTETQSGNKRYALAPLDVADVVDNAIRNMANVLRDGNATVENNVGAGLPPVMADASALTRCLQNLLSNAVKYGQQGQSASLEIHGRHIPETGKVELSVIDHGAGVADSDVAGLFEAFHRGSNATTNTPGNGLGLHLVERMMQAQNGSVRYEPAPGGGAKFTLTLQTAAGVA